METMAMHLGSQMLLVLVILEKIVQMMTDV